MIAHGAKHPGLQIPKGHVIGKAASVDLSVVLTVPIAAVDEHVGSPVASHIRERNGLVVKQQVRDRPGHRPIKARSERERTNSRPRSIPGVLSQRVKSAPHGPASLDTFRGGTMELLHLCDGRAVQMEVAFSHHRIHR